MCVWGGGGVRWGGRRGRAETLARFSFDTHCVSGDVNIFFIKTPCGLGFKYRNRFTLLFQQLA